MFEGVAVPLVHLGGADDTGIEGWGAVPWTHPEHWGWLYLRSPHRWAAFVIWPGRGGASASWLPTCWLTSPWVVGLEAGVYPCWSIDANLRWTFFAWCWSRRGPHWWWLAGRSCCCWTRPELDLPGDVLVEVTWQWPHEWQTGWYGLCIWP